MPKVSVIMAVYNTEDEEILKLSINSILNQTYKDFEFIICDDGSTDNTYNTLKKITKDDGRVILIRNTINLKAGAARNRCLQEASGEYIAIMDADDYSHPHRLLNQVDFLNNNLKISFVGTRGKYFETNVNDSKEKYWYCKNPKKQDFLVTLPFVHASIMFRRTSIDRFGGYSEEQNVYRSEDYDLLMSMYTKGVVGVNIDKELYYIRLDREAFKRRKYRYRINEAIVKYNGFKRLKLMPIGIIFAIKPLLIGLIPSKILNKVKSKYYNVKGDK